MAIVLSVNLNKIALLRNSREGNFPDPLLFGRRCLELGAGGLTVHPRPDQRHIRASDILPIAALVKEFPKCEFNMEGNPFAPAMGSYPGFLQLVEQANPHQCTLVPDSDTQLTSDHGFNLNKDGEKLIPILNSLKQQSIRSCLFMDPDIEQIQLAKDIGADRIELYTGPYAWACRSQGSNIDEIYKRYYDAASFAQDIGLGINAGHDLDLNNLPRFCNIPGLQEVSIGHALTVEALEKGWTETVTRYVNICNKN